MTQLPALHVAFLFMQGLTRHCTPLPAHFATGASFGSARHEQPVHISVIILQSASVVQPAAGIVVVTGVPVFEGPGAGLAMVVAGEGGIGAGAGTGVAGVDAGAGAVATGDGGIGAGAGAAG